MKLEITDLPNAAVPFRLSRLRCARPIWVNPDAASWVEGASGSEASRILAQRFAYVIPTTPCFADSSIDETDQCTLLAERYGGAGLGENGGGVRVGTGAGFQLKGIGTNCLVGAGTDASHAYGGLDAPLAISEIVLSHALSKVLPLGVLAPIGLLLTGGKTAFDDKGARCWGAILVREAAVRPAHFLRSGNYRVHPDQASLLPSDIARTRRTIADLRARLAAEGETVERFIEDFLRCCATQFAAARAARVAHSTISPSNIALDGRWLDVPMASFLPAGRNYSQAGGFYGEADVALDCAFALATCYTKYTGQQVATETFVPAFKGHFQAALAQHTASTFGLQRESIADLIDSPQWRWLVDATTWMIHRDHRREPVRPYPEQDEAMGCWLEGAFLAVQGDERAGEYLRRAHPFGDVTPESIGEALCFVLKHAYQYARSRPRTKGADSNDSSPNHEWVRELSFGAFVRRTMLIALRRARCSQFFYLRHINDVTNALCRSGRPEHLAPFIDDCRALADWVFAWENAAELMLFRTATVEIAYDSTTEQYFLNARESRRVFGTLSELLDLTRSWQEGPFSIRGFDFRPYLERLAVILDRPTHAGATAESNLRQALEAPSELTDEQLQRLLDQLPQSDPEENELVAFDSGL